MLGNVFFAGCQWAMLAALAKLGSTEMVGQFALATAIATPIMVFSNLKLRAVLASDANDEYSFSDYFSLRLITTPVALGIIAAIAAIGLGTDLGWVILFMGLAKAIEAFSDIFFGLFQQREQMKRIAISQFLKGGLSLLVFGSIVYATDNLETAVAGMAMSWAAILIAYDIPATSQVLGDSRPLSSNVLFSAFSRLRSNWNSEHLRHLAITALPLGITVLLAAVSISIPRYFIEHYQGTNQLGVFAGMSYVLVAGGLVINALGNRQRPDYQDTTPTRISPRF